MSERYDSGELLTFGGHLDVLRKMLFRIIMVIVIFGIVVFCFKTETFKILLAPRDSDFVTFRILEECIGNFDPDFKFDGYHVPLISTELSAQFMTHITVSCTLAFLLASPYVVFELFKFVSPALYERERRYSLLVAGVVYLLFLAGLLMSYFILFPVSFRFLATYSVDEEVASVITLDSYVSTFITLTFFMGVVFQLPVIVFVLGKMRLVSGVLLRRYRAHALVLIMIIAAVITPPDLFTLVLVTVPIYGLYELSILVLNRLCGGCDVE